MANISFKLKENQDRYDFLLKEYYTDISKIDQEIIHITSINYKRFGNNESYIILNLLYGLIFLKKIKADNNIITIEERAKMKMLQDTYDLEKV